MIKIDNLNKSYQGQKILSNINLHVPAGQIIAIVGRSGSGKTTLLRCIAGFETYSSGSIVCSGRCGFVFQNFHLFPHFTVLKNIIYAPMKVDGLSFQQAEERAYSLLDQVHLRDKAHSYPRSLSGGQRQRVALIQAIAMSPEVLLLDEPTSALDTHTITEIERLIRHYSKAGMTIVIVSHQIHLLRGLLDRVVVMANNSIESQHLATKFFELSDEELIKQYEEEGDMPKF